METKRERLKHHRQLKVAAQIAMTDTGFLTRRQEQYIMAMCNRLDRMDKARLKAA